MRLVSRPTWWIDLLGGSVQSSERNTHKKEKIHPEVSFAQMC